MIFASGGETEYFTMPTAGDVFRETDWLEIQSMVEESPASVLRNLDRSVQVRAETGRFTIGIHEAVVFLTVRKQDCTALDSFESLEVVVGKGEATFRIKFWTPSTPEVQRTNGTVRCTRSPQGSMTHRGMTWTNQSPEPALPKYQPFRGTYLGRP